eukprot:m.188337 g.188337  ORF g.188337 m.188337 type:complete len:920 (-) comp32339_c0_seq1:80-2839(-)
MDFSPPTPWENSSVLLDPKRREELIVKIERFSDLHQQFLAGLQSQAKAIQRKNQATKRSDKMTTLIQETAAVADQDWSCSVIPVADALRTTISDWDTHAEPGLPTGIQEIGLFLSKMFSANITEFLHGPDINIEVDDSDKYEATIEAVLSQGVAGVEMLLQLSKEFSKYSKDVACYLEKRTSIELDMHKKLAQLAKPTTAKSRSEFDDASYSTLRLENHNWSSLYVAEFLDTVNGSFIQPITTLRVDHDKKRKELKETWSKSLKRVTESKNALQRAKTKFQGLCEDWQRVIREIGKEPSSSKQKVKLEKRKKEEDEIRPKVVESKKAYIKCIKTANLLEEDVDSFRKILVPDLLSMLLECWSGIQTKLMDYSTALQDVRGSRDASIDMIIAKAATERPEKNLQSLVGMDYESDIGVAMEHEFEVYNLDASTIQVLSKIKMPNVCLPMGGELTGSMKSGKSTASKRMLRKRGSLSSIFGAPLEEQPLSAETGVPRVVVVFVRKVEECLDVEGLYRISGVKSHVEKLYRHLLESDPDQWSVPGDVTVVTSTFKLYLRKLPERLIGGALAKQLLHGVSKYSQSPTDFVKMARDCMRGMDQIRYKTLEFVMEHLSVVAKNHETTRMQASNLGIVFGPTLIGVDEHNELQALKLMPLKSECITMLIQNFKDVFNGQIVTTAPHSVNIDLDHVHSKLQDDGVYDNVADVLEVDSSKMVRSSRSASNNEGPAPAYVNVPKYANLDALAVRYENLSDAMVRRINATPVLDRKAATMPRSHDELQYESVSKLEPLYAEPDEVLKKAKQKRAERKPDDTQTVLPPPPLPPPTQTLPPSIQAPPPPTQTPPPPTHTIPPPTLPPPSLPPPSFPPPTPILPPPLSSPPLPSPPLPSPSDKYPPPQYNQPSPPYTEPETGKFDRHKDSETNL